MERFKRNFLLWLITWLRALRGIRPRRSLRALWPIRSLRPLLTLWSIRPRWSLPALRTIWSWWPLRAIGSVIPGLSWRALPLLLRRPLFAWLARLLRLLLLRPFSLLLRPLLCRFLIRLPWSLLAPRFLLAGSLLRSAGRPLLRLLTSALLTLLSWP